MSATADGDGPDARLTTDATAAAPVKKHAPVRHVVSVNGEEEDVENINIHDFTTFEQEQLIGSAFIGKLKRKSVCSDGAASDDSAGVHRGLSSFRSAVRAVLSSEAILQAMKHYNHRSDTETEEDDDAVEASDFFDNADDACASGNPDFPVSPTSAQSSEKQPEACLDKPGDPHTVSNSPTSSMCVEKPSDVEDITSSISEFSVSKDIEVEVEGTSAHASTEAGSPSRVAGTGDERTLVTDAVHSHELLIDVGTSPSAVPVPQAGNMPETAPVSDVGEAKPLLDDVDLSETREPAVTAAGNDSDDGDIAKPTDGLLTSTGERRQTETADLGCRCCCVQ